MVKSRTDSVNSDNSESVRSPRILEVLESEEQVIPSFEPFCLLWSFLTITVGR
jgi:hypothetical protein